MFVLDLKYAAVVFSVGQAQVQEATSGGKPPSQGTALTRSRITTFGELVKANAVDLEDGAAFDANELIIIPDLDAEFDMEELLVEADDRSDRKEDCGKSDASNGSTISLSSSESSDQENGSTVSLSSISSESSDKNSLHSDISLSDITSMETSLSDLLSFSLPSFDDNADKATVLPNASPLSDDAIGDESSGLADGEPCSSSTASRSTSRKESETKISATDSSPSEDETGEISGAAANAQPKTPELAKRLKPGQISMSNVQEEVSEKKLTEADSLPLEKRAAEPSEDNASTPESSSSDDVICLDALSPSSSIDSDATTVMLDRCDGVSVGDVSSDVDEKTTDERDSDSSISIRKTSGRVSRARTVLSSSTSDESSTGGRNSRLTMKVLTERLTQRDIERWTGVESAQKKATSSGRKASRKAASSSNPGTKKVPKRQQRSFEEQECKLFLL